MSENLPVKQADTNIQQVEVKRVQVIGGREALKFNDFNVSPIYWVWAKAVGLIIDEEV